MASRQISPAEPTTKYPPPIQPNAHPYAIKTTSSALLSRSTSSPYSANHTRHHYVPPPPSRIPIGTVVRHHHSSSLSSVEGELCDVKGAHTMPAPLPTPPSVVVSSQDNPKNANQPELTHRVRRAETMPSNATEPITENHSYDQKHEFSHVQDCTLELYVGLPPNPKQWNTDELITYLKTSFKFGSTANGDKEDSSLVDILECVRTRGLTGRELLRLTNADLAGYVVSGRHASPADRPYTRTVHHFPMYSALSFLSIHAPSVLMFFADASTLTRIIRTKSPTIRMTYIPDSLAIPPRSTASPVPLRLLMTYISFLITTLANTITPYHHPRPCHCTAPTRSRMPPPRGIGTWRECACVGEAR